MRISFSKNAHFVLPIIIIVAVFTLLGCSKNDERELVDLYLSQKRDSNLVGWWQCVNQSPDTAYTRFDGGGKIFRGSKLPDGTTYIAHKSSTYWYTKNGAIHYYEYQSSWAYGSVESSEAYKLSTNADSLYVRSHDTEEQYGLWLVKCEEPK